MRTVALLRCSTTGQSLDHQRAAAQRWAAVAGVTLEVVEEAGVSGVAKSRPVLESVVADCRAGRVQTLWVWELSRLGRSLVGVVTLLDELHGLGVRVVVSKEGIDYGTAAGRLMVHVVSALAEFERSLLRDRVVSGMDALRDENGKCTRTRSGMPAGKAAFIWDDETGREALALFAKMRADGMSWTAVAQAAQEIPIRVFRWALVDGRGDQVAQVPSLGAIRGGLSRMEVTS